MFLFVSANLEDNTWSRLALPGRRGQSLASFVLAFVFLYLFIMYFCIIYCLFVQIEREDKQSVTPPGRVLPAGQPGVSSWQRPRWVATLFTCLRFVILFFPFFGFLLIFGFLGLR